LKKKEKKREEEVTIRASNLRKGGRKRGETALTSTFGSVADYKKIKKEKEWGVVTSFFVSQGRGVRREAWPDLFPPLSRRSKKKKKKGKGRGIPRGKGKNRVL